MTDASSSDLSYSEMRRIIFDSLDENTRHKITKVREAFEAAAGEAMILNMRRQERLAILGASELLLSQDPFERYVRCDGCEKMVDMAGRFDDGVLCHACAEPDLSE